ncbi:MAG: Maf family protein [Propionibacteriaceae bacterium]
MRIILASASPARRDLLRRAGVMCDVIISNVDESTITNSDPALLTVLLAESKGRAVAQMLSQPSLIIAADTVVNVAGEISGKPIDDDAARQQWHKLSGSQATVHTGHWVGLLHADGHLEAVQASAATQVAFGTITETELDAYLATKEPLRAAGAFAIGGYGGAFIERIAGCAHNVEGLSLPLLRTLVNQLGLCWSDLWRC